MPSAFFLAADPHALDHAALRAFAAEVGLPPGPVCYIGAAHDDDRRWCKRGSDNLAKIFGREVHAPRLSDPALDVVAARRALDAAAVLFLDGGDTVGLCDHVRARGLADAFTALAKRDTLIAGISAGACAVAPFTIGYDDDERPQLAPCLALDVPVPLDVHSEDDDWSEMRALLEVLRAHPKLAQEGVVIPSRSALCVDRKGRMGSFGRRSCERRALDAQGRWKVTEIAIRS
ncbi:MAG: Type 1 glutamine amidotransferase-like domain-containing protein [Planctomycetota bacterium]